MRKDIDAFLHPSGVALIGQVNRNATAAQLRAVNEARYGEHWYLVNPKGGEIDGIPVYASVKDVPDPVSLAVLSTPPALTPAVLEEVADRGIKYGLIFTSGFAEVGPEGAAIEAQVAEVGRRRGLTLFGPNTNTNAFEKIDNLPGFKGGKIGVVTQSGHQGRPIVQGAYFGIGFSRQVPCGNEVDLEVSDFIEWFAYDDDTSVICGYVEGFKSIDKLRRALEACNRQRKPVILMKMGSTDAGSRMAASHTGHLTGSDAVVDGLFKQYGVIRVRDIDELIETAALFAKLPAGSGNRVGLYSISGGSGTHMSEMCELAGVPLPRLSDATQQKLRQHIPSYLTVSNPVDNGGNFVMQVPKDVRFEVLDTMADDPNVDVIIVGITGAVPPMSDIMGEDLQELATRGMKKPIIVTWNSFKVDEPGFASVVESGWPMFRSFRSCFGALRRFAEYQEFIGTAHPRPAIVAPLPKKAHAALASAGEHGGALAPEASRELLAQFKLPLAREAVVTSATEAARVAGSYGYPVVMKIASADFPHKSDAGLVRLGVDSAAAAKKAYTELIARARKVDKKAQIDGVLVQEMITDGVEAIIGVTHDHALGAAVMVGLGGIFAEIMRDTAVRPLPIDESDAWEMVHSLKGFPLLDGARGRPKLDQKALVKTILDVAKMASACGSKLAELDLNPVLVRKKGVAIVDNLVIAGPIV